MPEPFVVQPRPVAVPDASDRRTRRSAHGGTAPAVPARADSARSVHERHPVLEPLARYLDDPEVTDLFVNGSSGLFVDRGGGASPRARVARGGGGCARPRGRAHRARRPPHRRRDALRGRAARGRHPRARRAAPGRGGGHRDLDPRAAAGQSRPRRPRSAGHVRCGDPGAARGRRRPAREPARHGRRRRGQDDAARGAARCAPAVERIVTIEDVAELRIDHPHHVRLEARQANLEGAGGDRPRTARARGAAHAARPARRGGVPR